MDVTFPRDGGDEVTVTGTEDKVNNCVDHLVNLEEEYVCFAFISYDLLKYVFKLHIVKYLLEANLYKFTETRYGGT